MSPVEPSIPYELHKTPGAQKNPLKPPLAVRRRSNSDSITNTSRSTPDRSQHNASPDRRQNNCSPERRLKFKKQLGKMPDLVKTPPTGLRMKRRNSLPDAARPLIQEETKEKSMDPE